MAEIQFISGDITPHQREMSVPLSSGDFGVLSLDGGKYQTIGITIVSLGEGATVEVFPTADSEKTVFDTKILEGEATPFSAVGTTRQLDISGLSFLKFVAVGGTAEISVNLKNA